MSSIIPYLLSDFGTAGANLTPHNAMQNFVVSKHQSGVGYGIFGPGQGDHQIITKYTYDVSSATATNTPPLITISRLYHLCGLMQG